MKFCVYIDCDDTHNLHTNYSLKVINNKIIARDESLRLCMTDKLKRNTINIDMRFFKEI
jgi:hypothetical protein